MKEPKKIYLTFETTKDVILSERECKNAGFNCMAVPTPHEFTSQCGIALAIPTEKKEEIFTLLNKLGKKFKQIP